MNKNIDKNRQIVSSVFYFPKLEVWIEPIPDLCEREWDPRVLWLEHKFFLEHNANAQQREKETRQRIGEKKSGH